MSDQSMEPNEDDFTDDGDDLFSPEELEAMQGAASIVVENPTPEEKIAELRDQLTTMSAFIAEGVDREIALRRALHDLKEELRAAEVFQDVTFKFQALEKEVEAMGQATVEAKQTEANVRRLLIDLRERLPRARVHKN